MQPTREATDVPRQRREPVGLLPMPLTRAWQVLRKCFGGRRALAVTIIAAVTGRVSAEGAPPDLRTTVKEIGFSDSDVLRIYSGQAVACILPRRDNAAAFVTGMVRIDASEEALVDHIRRIDTLRSGGRTLQMGPFGTPPSLDDLAPLVFEDQDLKDLRKCRVGACEMQVGDPTIELAKGIDWAARDNKTRASRVLKEGLLARVQEYLQQGSLPVYENNDRPEPVASAFEQILAASPEMVRQDPALFEYLRRFPAARLSDVENFTYWAKDKARSPVVSAVHLCIHRVKYGDRTCYFVCLKHIYDSRYFIGYAEFLTLLPDPDTAKRFYFLRSVRALIDPPGGLLRGFLLGRIKAQMRDALTSDLGHIKQRLEASPGPR